MAEERENVFRPINIRELFVSKNPGLARFIPGFVYRYITRIMHIEFFNDLLVRNNHIHGMAFVNQMVTEFGIRRTVHGANNIPASGKFIFASNHPLGGFDGLLLMKTVDEKLGNPKFLTNDILLSIPQLREVFVPINKHGGHSREAATKLSQAYQSDAQILIFPSGLASRKIGNRILDLEWKKHFITKAIQYQRDVIPVFISGRNTNRFYRMANFRKRFHIKWNLEMFFLPDETTRHKNTHIHIWFGKPIPHTQFDRSKPHEEWAAWVREQVYQLPDEPPVANN